MFQKRVTYLFLKGLPDTLTLSCSSIFPELWMVKKFFLISKPSLLLSIVTDLTESRPLVCVHRGLPCGTVQVSLLSAWRGSARKGCWSVLLFSQVPAAPISLLSSYFFLKPDNSNVLFWSRKSVTIVETSGWSLCDSSVPSINFLSSVTRTWYVKWKPVRTLRYLSSILGCSEIRPSSLTFTAEADDPVARGWRIVVLTHLFKF